MVAMHALSLQSVSKIYTLGSQRIAALHEVSLDVARGEFIAVMGASGSGKSTLLHLAAGLDQPTSGNIFIEGVDLAAMGDHDRTLFRRRRLGVIFQAYNLLPSLSAVENVLLPRIIDGRGAPEAKSRALELLDRVGLTQRKEHRPGALSGGEQQRVAIARALMNDPAVILADEPTGNLDSARAVEIWRLLLSLSRQEQVTIVAVTHEAVGASHADRIIVLEDGRIKETRRRGEKGHVEVVASGAA